MSLHNPYAKFDKGMDDAYSGNPPSDTDSQQYMEGYQRADYLMNREEAQPDIDDHCIEPYDQMMEDEEIENSKTKNNG